MEYNCFLYRYDSDGTSPLRDERFDISLKQRRPVMKHILRTAAVLLAAYIAVSASGIVSAAEDAKPAKAETRKMSFSDKSGISFSLEITPCSKGEKDGKIRLSVEADPNGEDTYSYSLDMGKTFRDIKGKSVNLTKSGAKCRTFCLMKNGDRKTLTDFYTINAGTPADGSSVSASAVSSCEKIYKDGVITVRIENYEKGRVYEVSADGGKSWHELTSGKINFRGVSSGARNIVVRAKNGGLAAEVLRVPVPEAECSGKGYIKVEPILQNPELPTGCEATSLAMLLNHMGYKATKTVIADRYLPKGEYRASDFNKVFVGNPREENAYGCFAGVIAETAERYLEKHDKKGKWTVRNITGCTPEALYRAVDEKNPAVVWVSADMGEVKENAVTWTDRETGKEISWTAGEHCVLLTGYNKEKNLVYVNDPLVGRKSYDMDAFEEKFKYFGCNAVIITEK